MSLAFPGSSLDAVQHQVAALWHGSFLVTGLCTSDRNNTQQVFVTAVETDGEKYVANSLRSPLLTRLQQDGPMAASALLCGM